MPTTWIMDGLNPTQRLSQNICGSSHETNKNGTKNPMQIGVWKAMKHHDPRNCLKRIFLGCVVREEQMIEAGMNLRNMTTRTCWTWCFQGSEQTSVFHHPFRIWIIQQCFKWNPLNLRVSFWTILAPRNRRKDITIWAWSCPHGGVRGWTHIIYFLAGYGYTYYPVDSLQLILTSIQSLAFAVFCFSTGCSCPSGTTTKKQRTWCDHEDKERPQRNMIDMIDSKLCRLTHWFSSLIEDVLQSAFAKLQQCLVFFEF